MNHRIRGIVSQLPVNSIREIIKNYEELETEGAIGNCYLSTLVEKYLGDMKTIGRVHIMRDFSYEAYRFLALTHITVKEEAHGGE